MSRSNVFGMNSLSKKFLVPMVIFTFVLLSALGWTLIRQNGQTISEMLNKKGNNQADLLAHISANYVTNYDLSALEGFVKESSRDPDMAFVVFYDSQKKPLTESSKEPVKADNLLVFQRDIVNSGDNTNVIGMVKIGYSRKSIETNFQKGIRNVTGSTLVFLTLFVIGITFLFKKITNPLNHLVAIMEKAADGDLTQNVKSELLNLKDEVGILARAFSKMFTNLKDVIKKIQVSVNSVTTVSDLIRSNTRRVNDGTVIQSASAQTTTSSIGEMNSSIRNIAENVENLSSSSESTSSSIAEMSASINQVATSTDHLSSFIEETTASMLQMSASIKQMAENTEFLSSSSQESIAAITEMNESIREVEKNAQESAQLSEKVSQDASESGMKAINQTIEGIVEIKNTVKKSVEVIEKLEKQSGRIGNIISVIDDVVKQTKLLALNSSILAAQAGTQGHGFVVVADEIKALADRTDLSTKEITQVIKDVQKETREAVTTIKEGAKKAEEGEALSYAARTAFSNILDSSKRSSEKSIQIGSATREQVKAASNIVESMNKVNDMIQNFNNAIKDLRSGTLRITEASEKVKDISFQVKVATNEQAKGSAQINGEGKKIASGIQQISQAMSEQKKGSEVIMKSIVEINKITQTNERMIKEMNDAVEGLITQAGQLKEEVNHFILN